MSPEAYAEVSGDESGIAAPQSTAADAVPQAAENAQQHIAEPARPPEWPKRLRTLTAAELDRLTIDNTGRFYWDGKLVNYGADRAPTADQPSQAQPGDSSAEVLDHIARELEGAPTLTAIGVAPVAYDTRKDGPGNTSPQQVTPAEPVRVSLTRGQAVAAIVTAAGIAIGAIGIAACGYVAARDWGCRTGAFDSGCPVLPMPELPPRFDIPG